MIGLKCLFKIFNFKGFDVLDPCTFFYLNMTSTRGHSLKVVKPRCHLDIMKFSFARHIFNIWNGLDESIIACDSFNGFKNRIDKCLRGFI